MNDTILQYLRTNGEQMDAEIAKALHMSKPQVLTQIEAQLQKMVSTRHVQDVSKDPNGIERELALVKVRGTGVERVEALRVSDIFRAKVVDTTHESFVFELTGASSKIDKYVDLMRGLGLVEVSRTGVLSLQRGVEVV